MPALNLTDDFTKAARDLREVLPVMDTREEAVFPFDVKNIPFLKKQEWTKGDLCSLNNCYSFALDLKNKIPDFFLQPGHLYFQKNYPYMQEAFKARRIATWNEGLGKFSSIIQKGVILDGLMPLGHRLQVMDRGFPVALFFGEWGSAPLPDYHWYALRRDPAMFGTSGRKRLVWADKMASNPVSVCLPSCSGTTNIFDDAKSKGYDQFAGYFAVDKKTLQL